MDVVLPTVNGTKPTVEAEVRIVWAIEDFAVFGHILAANPSKIINRNIAYTNPGRGRELRFGNNVRSRAETANCNRQENSSQGKKTSLK